ncbi:hypothetical protein OEZ85_003212 [Tetradesmus obliquus]|uniref:Fibronectin type-III domain-containing protein n=1 Tax=Tetradesmus obliquus TaxID=3088 RepID=A0ABY8TZW8_TETOB|nr:hypothetical protein OEZ85_003212 [Tetradesmus obliquus]
MHCTGHLKARLTVAAISCLLLLAAGAVAFEPQQDEQQPTPLKAAHAAAAIDATPEPQNLPAGSLVFNSTPPAEPQRLVFIHHSTGQNWLADDNGGLGIALRDSNYYVADTNYGWGPDFGSGNPIGDRTDIGNWYEWFAGNHKLQITDQLYAEYGQYCPYSRLDESMNPGGNNTIVMFKSCFPNSALKGPQAKESLDISSNPLRGQDAYSKYHTVANAIGIYKEILKYFATRQDKLFVAITAPPLTVPEFAANARFFNNWLFSEWLATYPYKNVAVFDFYNVLTTNGGDPSINDIGRTSGNHHRYWGGVIQHRVDGDDDNSNDVSEYPSDDDHPSQAGNLKATAEFLPLLNIFWNCWKGNGACPYAGGGGTPPAAPTGLVASSRGQSAVLLQWSSSASNVAVLFVVARRAGAAAWVHSHSSVAKAPGALQRYNDSIAFGNPITTSYSYRVTACSVAGCSAATVEAVVPTAPIGVAATALSDSRIRLSWSPPGPASSSYSGYRLFRGQGNCTNSINWVMLKAVGAARVGWVDTVDAGLVPGQQYAYKLQAFKNSGSPVASRGYSWYSNCAAATVA